LHQLVCRVVLSLAKKILKDVLEGFLFIAKGDKHDSLFKSGMMSDFAKRQCLAEYSALIAIAVPNGGTMYVPTCSVLREDRPIGSATDDLVLAVQGVGLYGPPVENKLLGESKG
jgi:hypothetical protein